MSDGIEFEDRYTGGKQPHPWRYCRGGCEAMGAVPVNLPTIRVGLDPSGEDLGEFVAVVEKDDRLYNLAVAAHERGDGHEDGLCDGWHFVRCPSCKGTGEIPWYRALRYLPRMVRGTVRFAWQHGVHQDSRPPHWTRKQQWRIVLMIAAKRYGR